MPNNQEEKCANTLCCQLLQTCVTFQANYSVKRTIAHYAVTKSHTESMINAPQIIIYEVVEKEME